MRATSIPIRAFTQVSSAVTSAPCAERLLEAPLPTGPSAPRPAASAPGFWAGLGAKAVAAVVIGTLGFGLTIGAPLAYAETTPTEIAAETGLSAQIKAGLEQGLAEGKKQRSLAAEIGLAPGELLVSSKLPLLRNIGVTLSKAGQLASAPFTVISGAVSADGDRVKDGLDDFARGLLGLAGLEHVVMGEYASPGSKSVTGTIAAPKKYATQIDAARRAWRQYSKEEQDRDYHHGMKKWHALSNEKLVASSGLSELPWLLLGGLAHELDPGGISAEIDKQGLGAWAWDSPLDEVANVMGMLGGLLLPEGAHAEYARIVGNIIPGPHDPFEGADAGGSADAQAQGSQATNAPR